MKKGELKNVQNQIISANTLYMDLYMFHIPLKFFNNFNHTYYLSGVLKCLKI
jgi:hypothetical protein